MTQSLHLTACLVLLLVSEGADGYHACVTGASGYLGSELVWQLLQAGHSVTAAVRRPCMHLTEWQKHEEFGRHLQVQPGYDMLSEGSLDAAIHGAEVLYHVASPFPDGMINPEDRIVEACVLGMQSALASASRHQVPHVIITSSVAAVRGPSQAPSRGVHFSEEDWNTASRVDGPGMEAYQYAKTQSEALACDFAMASENGIRVASIVPSFLMGPPRPRHAHGRSTSIRLVQRWLSGEGKVQSRMICDVRDAAIAHRKAADLARSTQDTCPTWRFRRFIVGHEARTPAESLREALREACPEVRALSQADTWRPSSGVPIGAKEVDTSRAAVELGLCATDARVTVQDMGRALMEAVQK